MNKLETIVAVGVAGTVAALAACTGEKIPMTPAAKPKDTAVVTVLANPCTTPPPAVQVNINQVTVSGSTATIKVDPGEARIVPSGGSVQWKFNAPGYGLAPNGITFKPAQPAGPSASAGDTKDFYWCFGVTAPNPLPWKYNVSFRADATPTQIYDCDPTIINSVSLTALVAQTVSCSLRP